MIAHKPTPSKLSSHDKHTKLSRREQKVYDILKQGKKSVTQITIALGYADPRSFIRNLRNKGIIIFDEWIENEDTRYKRYFIEPEKHK